MICVCYMEGNKYKAQIDETLHYVYRMIRQDWTGSRTGEFEKTVLVDLLAEKSCMSKRSFQYFFRTYTGESPKQFIQRIRLEYALQLLREGNLSRSEIAERIGFANDTALYNSFKKKYDYTPGEYYKSFLSKEILNYTGCVNCKIINLPETFLLFLPYIGNYNQIPGSGDEGDVWERLRHYAASKGLLPESEEYWGICFDDADITDRERCRFYACITINSPVKSRLTDEIKSMVIPAGQYAVYLHKGSYDRLDRFYDMIFQNIPTRYDLRDELILERYLNDRDNTSETELLTEVLLPVVGNRIR